MTVSHTLVDMNILDMHIANSIFMSPRNIATIFHELFNSKNTQQ